MLFDTKLRQKQMQIQIPTKPHPLNIFTCSPYGIRDWLVKANNNY